MPGTSPACASSRKQMRQSPKRRYTARARPHLRHRVYARTLYFGSRCCFWISAFFATYYTSALEREAERGQQRTALVIGRGGRHDRDVHTSNRVDLVVVDLGKDQLLGDTERVIAPPVERVGLHP